LNPFRDFVTSDADDDDDVGGNSSGHLNSNDARLSSAMESYGEYTDTLTKFVADIGELRFADALTKVSMMDGQARALAAAVAALAASERRHTCKTMQKGGGVANVVAGAANLARSRSGGGGGGGRGDGSSLHLTVNVDGDVVVADDVDDHALPHYVWLAAALTVTLLLWRRLVATSTRKAKVN
jgi:hypothetical protein